MIIGYNILFNQNRLGKIRFPLLMRAHKHGYIIVGLRKLVTEFVNPDEDIIDPDEIIYVNTNS